MRLGCGWLASRVWHEETAWKGPHHVKRNTIEYCSLAMSDELCQRR